MMALDMVQIPQCLRMGAAFECVVWGQGMFWFELIVVDVPGWSNQPFFLPLRLQVEARLPKVRFNTTSRRALSHRRGEVMLARVPLSRIRRTRSQ